MVFSSTNGIFAVNLETRAIEAAVIKLRRASTTAAREAQGRAGVAPEGGGRVDGETLAVAEDGRPRAFQESMKGLGSGAMQPWFFDCLHRDGVDAPVAAHYGTFNGEQRRYVPLRNATIAPIARALLKAREGDEVTLVTPKGPQRIEVVSVRYPSA